MPKCCIHRCNNYTPNYTKEKHGISYFHFPRDPIRSQKWISIVGLQRNDPDFKPITSTVVCSAHFLESDMYETDGGVTRLVSTAVPRIMVPSTVAGSSETRGINLKLLPSTSQETELEEHQESDPLEEKGNVPLDENTNSSLEDNIYPTFQTIDCALETPREKFLKKQLASCRKRLVVRNKMYGNLKQKVKIIVKKYAALRNALEIVRNDYKQRFLSQDIDDCEDS